jgi:hypothetical protein
LSFCKFRNGQSNRNGGRKLLGTERLSKIRRDGRRPRIPTDGEKIQKSGRSDENVNR